MNKEMFVVAMIAMIVCSGAQACAADRDVRITTDRKRYENAQELSAMTLTVVNNSAETVFLSDLSFEQSEMRKKFAWVPLDNPMRGIRAYVMMELKPGESKQHAVTNFFLPNWPECKGRRAYRIAALVYSGCPGVGANRYPDSCSAVRVVYSSVFKVKKDK